MAASEGSTSWSTPEVHKHHEQQTVCHTRPKYREGRRPKAVKVYTINLESRFLLVQGVPAIGVMTELVQLFALYGAIEEYRVLDEYPAEQFTEVYLLKFQKLQSAKVAKRNLDERSFFGGLLHVCYAPEYESMEDTRQKIQDRRRFVTRALQNKAKDCDRTVEKSKMVPMAEVAVCEEEESRDIAEEPDNLTTDYLFGFPLLLPPPQEEFYQPSSFPESTSAAFRGHQGNIRPAEDRMGSTYHSADNCNPPTPTEPQQPPFCINTPMVSKQRKDSRPTARFIPRTTHLQNRKRKVEEAGQDSLLGIEDKSETLIGPKLPEQPKMDMEDESLNITANLIRSTMAKISAVPEHKPAVQKTTKPKPRRRI
ncbi:hypothetical protein MATL_G00235580 [Megalops atlanticus]|uniref:RNA-binding protein 48 n=1 Tax=Megalops atlanticus TaxID=7932 RepID=A0A9D3PE51_MEGAT|nr:hypothetical protein MATL_G00235580 [Megalops atlanticus]